MTKSHYRKADVDGRRVFYQEAGRVDGPTLLLLHGIPSAGHMFRERIPALSDRFRVVVPDLPGFGESDMPPRAMYPEFQAYFRKHKPPSWAVWGKHDPFFLPAGAEAFKRDIPGADVRFLDTGHFALETHCDEIAARSANFYRGPNENLLVAK